MLNLQQEYFKFRDGKKLDACKSQECRFRKLCEEILRPKTATAPTLYDGYGDEIPQH